MIQSATCFLILLGNEARQFGIKDGDYSFTVTPVDPVYTTFEDINGNLVQFVGKNKHVDDK